MRSRARQAGKEKLEFRKRHCQGTKVVEGDVGLLLLVYRRQQCNISATYPKQTDGTGFKSQSLGGLCHHQSLQSNDPREARGKSDTAQLIGCVGSNI